MKKLFSLLLIIGIPLYCSTVFAWGIYGHKHIAHAAIFALPADMGMFFYNHADFLTEESVVPDIRKHTLDDKTEVSRHYINLEAYNYTTPADMPQTLAAANEKYGADTLLKNGILAWYTPEMMAKLTKAFKDKNTAEILFLAGDLSHYVADAHMPLHTSINHNGQYTNQKGIHAFWESQLPEMFGDKYNYHTEEAHYLPDVRKATWAIIVHTYSLADTLLQADRDLAKMIPMKEMYELDSAGGVKRTRYGDPIHSQAYATRYNEMLHGMVEKQMRLAIQATADFWYTAWVNAGKPDLSTLDPEDVTERNKAQYKRDKQKWEQGIIGGFKANKEF